MEPEIKKTLSERASRYGHFYTKSKTIQILKEVFRETRNWDDLPDDMKESLDLIATKIGRILFGDPYYKDSWHDIIGYAALVEDRLNDPETKTLKEDILSLWGTPVEEVTDE